MNFWNWIVNKVISKVRHFWTFYFENTWTWLIALVETRLQQSNTLIFLFQIPHQLLHVPAGDAADVPHSALLDSALLLLGRHQGHLHQEQIWKRCLTRTTVHFPVGATFVIIYTVRRFEIRYKLSVYLLCEFLVTDFKMQHCVVLLPPRFVLCIPNIVKHHSHVWLGAENVQTYPSSTSSPPGRILSSWACRGSPPPPVSSPHPLRRNLSKLNVCQKSNENFPLPKVLHIPWLRHQGVKSSKATLNVKAVHSLGMKWISWKAQQQQVGKVEVNTTSDSH